MSRQNTSSHQFDKDLSLRDKEVWDDDEFLKEIDQRIAEIETDKVTGSIWEEVKAKSKC